MSYIQKSFQFLLKRRLFLKIRERSSKNLPLHDRFCFYFFSLVWRVRVFINLPAARRLILHVGNEVCGLQAGCGEKPHHLHGLERLGQLVDAASSAVWVFCAFAYYASREQRALLHSHVWVCARVQKWRLRADRLASARTAIINKAAAEQRGPSSACTRWINGDNSS